MERPIFVVGCPSSGTTLLYSILVSHPHISCGHETDFLVDFRKIVEGNRWNKLQSYGFDKQYWHQKFAELFSNFKTDYARQQGKQRWADKTPSYTPHLDFICELFPNCQIIHVIRDGRDVVMSHKDRWGYKSALKAIYKWREYITSAREFGKTLPQDRYLEIRYEDLVMHPDSTTKSLFDYLEEPWEPKVLKFEESATYNPSGEYEKFAESRRQKSNEKSFIYSSRIGKGQNLDPILKGLFNFSDRQLLKELGY